MKTVEAVVHSLNALDTVTIVSENGVNNVIAEYKGVRCTAIYNVFNGRYYVDDIYGVISEDKDTQEHSNY